MAKERDIMEVPQPQMVGMYLEEGKSVQYKFTKVEGNMSIKAWAFSHGTDSVEVTLHATSEYRDDGRTTRVEVMDCDSFVALTFSTRSEDRMRQERVVAFIGKDKAEEIYRQLHEIFGQEG